MEYVLATSLGPLSEATCCSNCWQMFQLFYDFKKSCMFALSKKFTILRKDTAKRDGQDKLNAARLEKDLPQAPSSTEITAGPKDLPPCEICKATFTDNTERRLHLNIHYGIKPFKCINLGCKDTFYLPKERNEHSAECPAPAPAKPFSECMTCYQVFTEAEHLQQHLSTTSCGGEHQQPDRRESTGVSNTDPLHHTSSTLQNPGSNCSLPEEPQTPQSPAASDQSDDGNDTDWFPKPKLRFPKGGLQCIKCNNVFRDMSHIRSHKAGCREENSGSEDTNTVDMESNLVCQRCEIRFTNTNHARYHLFRCQDEPEPLIAVKLKCPHCPKALRSQADFEGHVNKHNGIKPFACRISGCTKVYHSSALRRNHEKFVHEKVSSVCTVCGITIISCSYAAHMLIHEERRFACEICGKRFIRKYELQKHTSVHSGERNFECKVCGKKFKSYEANRVHQRIHTEEKPYRCSICDMRFTYNCSLKAHMEKGQHG